MPITQEFIMPYYLKAGATVEEDWVIANFTAIETELNALHNPGLETVTTASILADNVIGTKIYISSASDDDDLANVEFVENLILEYQGVGQDYYDLNYWLGATVGEDDLIWDTGTWTTTYKWANAPEFDKDNVYTVYQPGWLYIQLRFDKTTEGAFAALHVGLDYATVRDATVFDTAGDKPLKAYNVITPFIYEGTPILSFGAPFNTFNVATHDNGIQITDAGSNGYFATTYNLAKNNYFAYVESADEDKLVSGWYKVMSRADANTITVDATTTTTTTCDCVISTVDPEWNVRATARLLDDEKGNRAVLVVPIRGQNAISTDENGRTWPVFQEYFKLEFEQINISEWPPEKQSDEAADLVIERVRFMPLEVGASTIIEIYEA